MPCEHLQTCVTRLACQPVTQLKHKGRTCRARSASVGAPAIAEAGSGASGARALSEAAFTSASSPVKLRHHRQQMLFFWAKREPHYIGSTRFQASDIELTPLLSA